MRATALLLLAAAALFVACPLAERLGAIPGALLSVALAVLFALAASGGVSALAAAYGALGAFAAGMLSPGASAIGGALLVAGAYAERTTRVRGDGEVTAPGTRRIRHRIGARAVHLGLAIGGGAIAGTIVASFADAGIAVRAVAIIVAAVLASLPRLVEVDDLVAHALKAVAGDVDEPAKRTLLAGADLRAHADDALLDRRTAGTVRRTWRALCRLAEARLRVQLARVGPAVTQSPVAPSPTDAVLSMLDTRIAEHVTALARAYSAVDTARAAELGLDDVALRTAESAGEALEQVSRAMVDVQP